ncbi:MAG: 4-(cytidine 5'-diphospho)-2-C-methyl-D-erythritol kinase [Ruminococcus sp.]|nr:4-(cytidine 5'-diphospho)-2-C-methyl-D-erythritol kinase [Ruminococcus sp.]
MRVKAAAKINLALDVTGKLPNGYHEIESVFQTVAIFDDVTVELIEKGIELTCEIPESFDSADPIPCDERNIAYKAAKMFLEESGLNLGCRIHIEKQIPSQAGMGGGSTDAAAVLHCLSKLTRKTFSAPERLGADVPFFLTGGTAYVTGIGEKVRKIADCEGKILVIAKGKEGVSTAKAYAEIDALEAPAPVRVKELVKAIENGRNIAKYIGNIFEEAVKLSEVDDIKKKMISSGAKAACMTGSGSAVFGLFKDIIPALKCQERLEADGYFALVTDTVPFTFIGMR